MKDGFIKAAAAEPNVFVAAPEKNARSITENIKKACDEGVSLLVFPELAITGYTCGDLFFNDTLIKAGEEALLKTAAETINKNMLIFAGLPLFCCGRLYNVAAAIFEGKILAFIPKTNIPNYGEFYEERYFEAGEKAPTEIMFRGNKIPFGTDIIISFSERKFAVAAEICEDAWCRFSPSERHTAAGANILVNLSASPENIGKRSYREELIKIASAKNICGYIYANAGADESTEDVVYSGNSFIAENGNVLAERKPFGCSGSEEKKLLISEIDCGRLNFERRRTSDFKAQINENYRYIDIDLKEKNVKLTRSFQRKPFVPSDEKLKSERCSLILDMQAYALIKRLNHTKAKKAVIGISGGLDSTLAVLGTVEAFKKSGKELSDIITVSMPSFGTGERTRSNATVLSELLKTDHRIIDIRKSVARHLEDIKHDGTSDTTFENAQARERTQVLMDIANKENGIVIGTGDLSEAALGFSTYNGDQMSMYNLNCTVPKTLVRYIIDYYADTVENEELRKVLLDISATPVSPELLPNTNGELQQKTEDIIGEYELHDFFLYYFIRFGFSPEKIYRIAKITFKGIYSDEHISSTLNLFFKRFFIYQFKRTAVPAGVKVGSVSLSPRGDFRMPSDIDSSEWLKMF